MKKTALITGINGQTGSYLAEYLLEQDYQVVGTVKRNSVSENQTYRINHIMDKLDLEYADMLDMPSLMRVVSKYQPDEIYNLAAQSHVRISFDQPIYTAQVTGIGVLNILEVVRQVKPDTKLYQASSSEMFGNSVDNDNYQRENTPMNPVSPYGCAKLYAYNMMRNYRHSYGLFASNGILFNHESPRRGENFVTNKVCKAAVEIKKGKRDKLGLGNLNAHRDWGHAKDYCKAMHLILQHYEADDFVCATGESRSVRDLCLFVFEYLGMDYQKYVIQEDKYLRPEELHILKGDSSKLRKMGWKPEYTFESMIKEMVDYWMEKI